MSKETTQDGHQGAPAINATDNARALAEELGVDLAHVKAQSVLGSLVTVQDVRRHVASASPATRKRTSKAKAKAEGEEDKDEEDEEDVGDPLLLDQCEVTVQWPLVDGTVREFAGVRVHWRSERAKAGRKRRYLLAFPDGDTRLSRLHNHVPFTVTASNHRAGRLWTRRELNALLARSQAAKVPESKGSIAVAMGRTLTTIRTRVTLMTSAAYAQYGSIDGVQPVERCYMGWRAIVGKAMKGMPGRRGTLAEIYCAVKALPELMGKLDESVYPGTKETTRWQRNVANVLYQRPEFTSEKTVAVGVSVYTYHEGIHRLGARRAGRTRAEGGAAKKGLDYVKAFR